jgi:FAD/FMN-containing dehydrogenase
MLPASRRLGVLLFAAFSLCHGQALATEHAAQDPQLINNVTQLYAVQVGSVVTPTHIDEIVTALRQSTGPVSVGGGRFSQGGQVAYPGSLHVDMRQFNKIVTFDKTKKTLCAQAGARWRDIQSVIDPQDLSVSIMQTYANFTVGGSLSVNVHGRYVGKGPIVSSVLSIEMVMADGSIKTASPTENADLFYGAIGGYGGLGIITQACLQLTDNQPLARDDRYMAAKDYTGYFFSTIHNNPKAVFSNATLYPPRYDQVRAVTWYTTDKPLTQPDRLIATGQRYFWQAALIDWVADHPSGLWWRQHLLEPVYYWSSPVVWRNYEASYDLYELEPSSRTETTYGLREYFVPVEQFSAFIQQMRQIFQADRVNVVNVSIRHAQQDPGTLLAWAKSDVFAFVVYYRQGTDAAAQSSVQTWTRALNDAAIHAGGSYYLPYQVHETAEQFRAAYPNAQRYLALKKALDPHYRFRNQLLARVFPPENEPAMAEQPQEKN